MTKRKRDLNWLGMSEKDWARPDAGDLVVKKRRGEVCEKQGCDQEATRRANVCKNHVGVCLMEDCRSQGKVQGFCRKHKGGKQAQEDRKENVEEEEVEGEKKKAQCEEAREIRGISHVHGKRCQEIGCLELVASGHKFCKVHGGDPPAMEERLCQEISCFEVVTEPGTDYCIVHRFENLSGNELAREHHSITPNCLEPGCLTKARDLQSGRCTAHGGGKRCEQIGCDTSARGKGEDGRYYCSKHGGRKRCEEIGCDTSANGKGADGRYYCTKHGGGKRCEEIGCDTSAKGKGADGRYYCTKHGGGKRCEEIGCDTNAKGKGADGRYYCAKHGGGKRCEEIGCGTGAKGKGADGRYYCGKHGGGKRYEEVGCDSHAAGGKVGSRFLCRVNDREEPKSQGQQLCQEIECFQLAQPGADHCIVHCVEKVLQKHFTKKKNASTKSRSGDLELCIARGGGTTCEKIGCDTTGKDVDDRHYCVKHGERKRCKETGRVKKSLVEKSQCTSHDESPPEMPFCKDIECFQLVSEPGDKYCFLHILKDVLQQQEQRNQC